MKTDDSFSILQEKIVSAGLPIEQAKEYVWFISGWHRDDLKSGKLKPEDILPSDECLNTLAEVHRIVTGAAMNKMNPRTLHPVQIRRFLSEPDIKWKESKDVIATTIDNYLL